MRNIICIAVYLYISFNYCFATANICNIGNFNITDDSLATITKHLSEGYNSEKDFTVEARQLYCYALKNNKNYLKALAANYFGFRQYVKANIDSAYMYLNETNKILTSSKPNLTLIKNLELLGLVDILKEDYVSAKNYFDETERLVIELKLESKKIDIYNNKGLLFMKLSQYEKAQDYLQRVAKLAKENDAKIALGYSYLNIAQSKHKLNAPIDSVLYYLELAGKAWSMPEYNRGLAYYYNHNP